MTCRKLSTSVSWSGTGLHSGEPCKVTISPSNAPLSISIRGFEAVPIWRLSCSGSSRGSDLTFPDGGKIRTVEHLLSSVVGLGLWRSEIIVDGSEIPTVDGCSETFSRTLLASSELCDCEDSLSVYAPICVSNGGASVFALPSEKFCITYVIKYDNSQIGTQMFDYADNDGNFFIEEISRARTFALERDIKLLRENGMALGGSLDNAILVCEDEVKTSGGLRYKDEFVRHKVLDLLGDLALVGCPLNAHIVAIRAGHAPHLAMVEKLRRLQYA